MTSTPARPALLLLGARLGLVALATLAAWLPAVAVDPGAAYPPTPMLVTLALLPVNVVSLWWVIRLLRSEGRTLRDLFGVRAGRGMLADLGWAMLWIAVLYVPFVGAVIGTMWLLHGEGLFDAFATVFVDPDAAAVASPHLALILGIVAVVTFAPLNAPAEEAVYRGYAQSRLTSAWSGPASIVVCSVAFGLQHAFFAPTADAMVVYVAAFTVWGLGSALIVRRQQRLMPIVIAHFVVNLLTSSPAVVFPALQLAGVVPV